MSQEYDPDIPDQHRLEESSATHLVREFLSIPACSRRAWVNRPNIRFQWWPGASDCLRNFMTVQAEKFKAGKELRCSEGLAIKIRRLALEDDLDI